MIWMIPLAMAAIGAMADKKNPVRGAALGAGIGMTGGLLAPAAAGAAGAAGAGAAAAGAGAAGATSAGAAGAGLLGDATAAGYGGLTAADAASMGGGASVAGGSALGSSGATTGTGLLGALNTYGKPASQAMQMAQQTGLMGGQQKQPQPSFQQPMTGNQTLNALVQQGQQEQGLLAQADAERRKRRLGLLGRMA